MSERPDRRCKSGKSPACPKNRPKWPRLAPCPPLGRCGALSAARASTNTSAVGTTPTQVPGKRLVDALGRPTHALFGRHFRRWWPPWQRWGGENDAQKERASAGLVRLRGASRAPASAWYPARMCSPTRAPRIARRAFPPGATAANGAILADFWHFLIEFGGSLPKHSTRSHGTDHKTMLLIIMAHSDQVSSPPILGQNPRDRCPTSADPATSRFHPTQETVASKTPSHR